MTKAPVTVFYHADCLDGFGAAYGAWRHFGDSAHYRPLHHGEPWEMEEVSGHEIYILDFSFPPELLEKLAQIAHSVSQIDHHASALKAWGNKIPAAKKGLRCFQHPSLKLCVAFDLDKSGARLSWEHFHPDTPVPLPLLHIEDQDMWRFRISGTRAFCRALRLLPFDFAIWHQLITEAANETTARYIATCNQGAAIEQFYEREVEQLAQSSLRMPARLRGEPADTLQARRHGQTLISDGELSWQPVTGIAINANALFASELGNLLAEQSGSFALIWQLSGSGDIKASLRSKGKSLDVSAIATRYGGGGHPNAAGFRMPAEQFLKEVLKLPANEAAHDTQKKATPAVQTGD